MPSEPMPTPMMEPPPRMPTPQPTPPPPTVKIARTGELAGLLPLSAHRLHYGYRSYPTGVHLFEAFKFIGVRDDLAERVRFCGTVEEAIAVAESLKEYWRGDWEEVKLEMLESVLYHKFVQRAALRGMLMETGGADLVFADPDVVWGDGDMGQGLNLIGRALMQVRARLREEGSIHERPTCGELPFDIHCWDTSTTRRRPHYCFTDCDTYAHTLNATTHTSQQ
ncbi:hypothetical protein V8D89_003886 [Ganoderma adspersum]